MGVFATRSPFRPNPVGLSCVKLEKIDLESKEAPVLIVSGADLMDGTPIYDIKPYLPVADCHPEALGGFATKVEQHFLQVEIPEEWKARIPEDKLTALEGVLRGSEACLPERSGEDIRNAFCRNGCSFSGKKRHTYSM